MIHIGDLVCAAATSVNNQTTAVPFTIPVGVPYLYFRTTAADATVKLALYTATPPTLAALSTDFLLVANQALPLDVPSYNPASSAACAAFSTAGATINVFQDP